MKEIWSWSKTYIHFWLNQRKAHILLWQITVMTPPYEQHQACLTGKTPHHVGDTRQCAIRCEEVKIIASLIKNGSGKVVLEGTSYLIPYVLIEGTIDAIGLNKDAPIPKDDSDVVDMDICAILGLSAPFDSHGPVTIGSIGCILGSPHCSID